MNYKTISYQKCVCFIFLVILSILNCSGFRIDNLPMTDISNKRNSFAHTSTSLSPLNIFSFSSTNSYPGRNFASQHRNEYTSPSANFFLSQHKHSSESSMTHHKIRHHHQLRMMQTKHSRNAAAGSAPVTSSSPQELFFRTDSEESASALINLNNIQKRSFRKKNHKKPWKDKPTEDITWNAYQAQYVFHAKVTARKNSSDSSWMFKIETIYKGHPKNLQFQLDGVQLGTRQNMKRSSLTGRKHRHQHHQDSIIQQSYLLFLNRSSHWGYTSVGPPKFIDKQKRKFNDTNLKKICSPNFSKFLKN